MTEVIGALRGLEGTGSFAMQTSKFVQHIFFDNLGVRGFGLGGEGGIGCPISPAFQNPRGVV